MERAQADYRAPSLGYIGVFWDGLQSSWESSKIFIPILGKYGGMNLFQALSLRLKFWKTINIVRPNFPVHPEICTVACELILIRLR